MGKRQMTNLASKLPTWYITVVIIIMGLGNRCNILFVICYHYIQYQCDHTPPYVASPWLLFQCHRYQQQFSSISWYHHTITGSSMFYHGHPIIIELAVCTVSMDGTAFIVERHAYYHHHHYTVIIIKVCAPCL